MSLPDHDALAALFGVVAAEAGAAILRIYEAGCAVTAKADDSPVTEADLAADAIILDRLGATLPGVALLSEETIAAGPYLDRDPPATFILIDPLDGTREFIQRNGEFTVNIALIEDGAPVIGAIYTPVLGQLHLGRPGRAETMVVAPGAPLSQARGRREIAARKASPSGLVAAVSRSHGDARTEAMLAGLPITERFTRGSSLKFCAIAEGLVDIYPRFSPTMEWDVAAGHAVVAAAGGRLTQPDGAPFRYGKRAAGYRNGPFIARGAG